MYSNRFFRTCVGRVLNSQAPRFVLDAVSCEVESGRLKNHKQVRAKLALQEFLKFPKLSLSGPEGSGTQLYIPAFENLFFTPF